MIAIIIDGQPVAKGRARIARNGIAYTPAKTRAFESHGRMAAQIVMDGREPLAGPLAVTVSAVLPVPASWSRRKTADALSGAVRPISRPDADNYLKSALDAVNGIVWRDDSQVVDCTVRKLYGADPRLVIEIEEIAA
jgi:Holliday junction resolvase RusA-like endonuclease